MNTYDVIYLLKPDYEDTKRGGKDWWKLTWRPIWRHTFSVYTSQWWGSGWSFGISYNNTDADNGWNRYYKHRSIRINLYRLDIHAWIRWDFIVHKDGPSDAGEKRPLVF